jgi:hypothetical protein
MLVGLLARMDDSTRARIDACGGGGGGGVGGGGAASGVLLLVRMMQRREEPAGTLLTCFTGTKVQILTPEQAR